MLTNEPSGLIMINFSFSHTDFYWFRELSAIFINLKLLSPTSFSLEESKIGRLGKGLEHFLLSQQCFPLKKKRVFFIFQKFVIWYRVTTIKLVSKERTYKSCYTHLYDSRLCLINLDKKKTHIRMYYNRVLLQVLHIVGSQGPGLWRLPLLLLKNMIFHLRAD